MNWLAILVTGLVPMALGFAWYHKNVFGKTWMDSLGFKEEDLQGGNMGLIFGLSYVLAIVAAMFVNQAVGHSEGEFATFKHGAFHGMFIGLMVALPVLATNALFERRGWKNIGVNVGYWIVNFALMGGILAIWR
ncbi:MAG: DUF1761 domain-containing protein [Bacteroidota bacterium]